LNQHGTNERDTPRHHFRINHGDNGSNREFSYVDNGTFGCMGGDPALLSQCVVPWVRMIRRGYTFYTYLAEDNDGSPGAWCLVGSDSWTNVKDQLAAQDNTVLVGMFSSSHNTCGTTLMPYTFDNLHYESLEPCPPSACSAGETITGADFAEPDGTSPTTLNFIVVQGGDFAPVITGERLRLSQDPTGGTANAVWYPTDGADLASAGFAVEFDAFMSGGNPPADGFTFAAVAGNAAYAAGLRGDGGGSLGYDGNSLRGNLECHPSFAVEMDNWVGGGEPGNEGTGSPGSPDTYHMGIDVNSSVSSIQTNLDFTGDENLPDIFNPAGIHVEVVYLNTGSISVYVSGNDGSYARRLVLQACIPALPGPDLLLGFTAGTGGAVSTQEVDNVRLSNLCCEAGADTVSIQGDSTGSTGTPVQLTADVGGADGAITYEWSVSPNGSIVGPADAATVMVDGTGVVTVTLKVNDTQCAGATATKDVTFSEGGGGQIPGDMNQDGKLDISDAPALLGHLFLGTFPLLPCEGGDRTAVDPGPGNLALLDSNGDGQGRPVGRRQELELLVPGRPGAGPWHRVHPHRAMPRGVHAVIPS
jgi:hypothetical protein